MKYNQDMKVNKSIQIMMIEKNINNKQLAELTGRTPSAISNTLNNQENLSLDNIFVLSNALGYDLKISFVDRETGKIIEVD